MAEVRVSRRGFVAGGLGVVGLLALSSPSFGNTFGMRQQVDDLNACADAADAFADFLYGAAGIIGLAAAVGVASGGGAGVGVVALIVAAALVALATMFQGYAVDYRAAARSIEALCRELDEGGLPDSFDPLPLIATDAFAQLHLKIPAETPEIVELVNCAVSRHRCLMTSTEAYLAAIVLDAKGDVVAAALEFQKCERAALEIERLDAGCIQAMDVFLDHLEVDIVESQLFEVAEERLRALPYDELEGLWSDEYVPLVEDVVTIDLKLEDVHLDHAVEAIELPNTYDRGWRLPFKQWERSRRKNGPFKFKKFVDIQVAHLLDRGL